MRVPRHRTHVVRAISTRLGLPAGASLLALICAACAPTSASAWTEGHGPKYTLQIVEGETTLPEYQQIASTSGHIEPSAQVAVSIIRNGTTVYRDVQSDGSAWLSQVPQVGETVTLESPVGRVIGSVDYDGLPSIDSSVCAGSTNFSGENTSGYTVEGSYVTYSLKTNPYGHVTGVKETNFGAAQVKSLSGTTFGGSFLSSLTLGETVAATESLKTPLAGEATYTYISEFQRPVGTCPAPPPPAPPAATPVVLLPALGGSLFKLGHATIHGLLKSGWSTEVTINQAGTVTEDLYAQGGTPPAYASSATESRKHHKSPPALLLARGTASAKGAGTVAVVLRVTKKGRAALKHDRRIKAVLVTTLRSGSGAKLSLSRRSVTLSA